MLAKVRAVSLQPYEEESGFKITYEGDLFQEILSYSWWFGIHEQQLTDFINRKQRGNSFEEKCRYVLEDIESLKYSCINQAAQHNKKLKDYQEKAVNHMLKNRGMIAAFEVGTGKTLTAVTVANCNINMAKYFGVDLYVIVMTPVSLQQNFIKEMRAYGINENVRNSSGRYIYEFYTPEKFSRDYKQGIVDCRQTLFIIDEAHNMRTDYRGVFSLFAVKKENQGRAENSILCSVDAWKVLLLTGTPVYNSTADIVNLVAMVDGFYPPTEENPLVTMYDKESFREQYGNRFLFQKNNKNDFPQRKDITLGILMNREFLDEYERVEESVMKESERKRHGKTDEEIERKTNAFYIAMRTGINEIDPCLKCYQAVNIMINAYEKKEKVLFFSEFLDSGVELIQQKLPRNITRLIINGKIHKNKRQQIVDNFNQDWFNGVLIITKAGGEGLDLRGVRHVIAYEKGWNVSGMEQFIGRAIRYRSHSHLSPEKQNVTVWHLIMLKNTDFYQRRISKDNPLYQKTGESIYLPEEIYKFSDEVQYSYNDEDLDLYVRYTDKSSADLYMYMIMLKKEKELQQLRDALEEIQI